MSPSRNLPLCLRCRSAIAGFLWRTASHLLKRRLRLAYRPETNDSGFASARRHRVSLATYSSFDSSFAPLTLIGATSFAGDSMSPSRNLPLCLRCRSAIAGFLWRTASHLLRLRLRSSSQETACRRPETYRSAFAAARQSRGFSGGLRLICSDFAYARLRRRQHVSTCFVIGKLS